MLSAKADLATLNQNINVSGFQYPYHQGNRKLQPLHIGIEPSTSRRCVLPAPSTSSASAMCQVYSRKCGLGSFLSRRPAAVVPGFGRNTFGIM